MSTRHLTNTEVSFKKNFKALYEFIIDFFHIKIFFDVSGQSKNPRVQ